MPIPEDPECTKLRKGAKNLNLEPETNATSSQEFKMIRNARKFKAILNIFKDKKHSDFFHYTIQGKSPKYKKLFKLKGIFAPLKDSPCGLVLTLETKGGFKNGNNNIVHFSNRGKDDNHLFFFVKTTEKSEDYDKFEGSGHILFTNNI
jgi:hypothetical protein